MEGRRWKGGGKEGGTGRHGLAFEGNLELVRDGRAFFSGGGASAAGAAGGATTDCTSVDQLLMRRYLVAFLGGGGAAFMETAEGAARRPGCFGSDGGVASSRAIKLRPGFSVGMCAAGFAAARGKRDVGRNALRPCSFSDGGAAAFATASVKHPEGGVALRPGVFSDGDAVAPESQGPTEAAAAGATLGPGCVKDGETLAPESEGSTEATRLTGHALGAK